MKNYVIITDSTTDLPPNIVDELSIEVIPMTFEIEGKSYLNYPDNRKLDAHEFYEMVRKGSKSTTSLVNMARFMELFEPIIKSGKDIMYIAFSSGLSGTYNASLLAAEALKEKYHDCKVICVDSKAASLGEGLLVYTAAKKKAEGMNIDELHRWLKDNILKVCQWFTVDDLNHLKRGGRINAVTATLGTALNIKPVLHVDNEGHLISMFNVRGRKKSLYALVEHMVDTCVNPDEQVIFIGHGDCREDAEYVARLIREKFNVRDIVINFIGPVIGTHSGPGTVALFFFGSSR